MEKFLLTVIAMVSAALPAEMRKIQFNSSDEIVLDMAPNSVDDSYADCTPQMLKNVLNNYLLKEQNSNSVFKNAWNSAEKHWQKHPTKLPSGMRKEHALAMLTYTKGGKNPIYEKFNAAVRRGAKSYKTDFSYKSLHFLLVNGLHLLKQQEGQPCRVTYRGTSKLFRVQKGSQVRFGSFASSSPDQNVANNFAKKSLFKIKTCLGADVMAFSSCPKEKEVLIPPHEKFEVTRVTKGRLQEIELISKGSQSNLMCALFRKTV
ncbi:erythroblast NAD(P)(+)--arginine ADP-ribosyltransferase-like [Lepisosteus oculatus]|uniref:NAD(P)(+)--arginine ADP-ribosyltransferase n=1 Tax=Lepisosteus oculatus TaxID=7918 RepID=W5MN61_LEPOC|nr:PREDICTED: erythroblast NAD(P)(+)--arginine ADP-ribosyltransferase-like [Lepisosteus oculatus]